MIHKWIGEFLKWLEGPTKAAEPGSRLALLQVLRLPIALGAGAIALFFGGLLLWSALAPLSGGAFGVGTVSPEGSRKTVQHLEGGIIFSIEAKDGDVVKAGASLVVLENTQARTSYDLVSRQRFELMAKEARLEAERSGVQRIAWPAELEASAEPGAKLAIDAQQHLFGSRKEALAGQVNILNSRIAQLKTQIAGYRNQIASQNRQIKLIDEQIADVQNLLDKGLAQKPRLLDLKRQAESIRSSRSGAQAQIAQTETAIGEAELQIASLEYDFQRQVADEIDDTRSMLGTLEERVTAARDVLKRTVVSAPVSGTVVNSRFKTPGGVIRPGEPILDLVPSNGSLIIDARIAPRDVHLVRPGVPASVRLMAFQQRALPRIMGIVRSVSADALTDERSGLAYYEAQVEIEGPVLDALVQERGVRLKAGMPVEVIIVASRRTILAYLFEPFFSTYDRAVR